MYSVFRYHKPNKKSAVRVLLRLSFHFLRTHSFLIQTQKYYFLSHLVRLLRLSCPPPRPTTRTICHKSDSTITAGQQVINFLIPVFSFLRLALVLIPRSTIPVDLSSPIPPLLSTPLHALVHLRDQLFLSSILSPLYRFLLLSARCSSVLN